MSLGDNRACEGTKQWILDSNTVNTFGIITGLEMEVCVLILSKKSNLWYSLFLWYIINTATKASMCYWAS